MIQFVRKSTLIARMFIMIMIFMVLGIGIKLYSDNIELIGNFKPYYLKAYSKEILFFGNSVANASSKTGNTAASIPVLLYHGIINNEDGSNVPIDNFIDQMLTLKKQGYMAISLDDFYQFKFNNKKLPAKSILITFDDGRKDSYYPVDPILKAMGFRATMFVITSTLDDGSSFYLSKNELAKANDSGRWDIQAHAYNGHGTVVVDKYGTRSDFYSNKDRKSIKPFRLETDAEYKNRVEHDLEKAKTDIENNLGIKSYAFAYPFGDYGQRSLNNKQALPVIENALKKYYKLAFSQTAKRKGFSENYRSGDLVAHRIIVDPSWKGADLLSFLNKSATKDLPYSMSSAPIDNGWLTGWSGTKKFTDNGMTIQADKNLNGVQVYLDGTGNWTDYKLKSEIDWRSAKNISLMVRYVDDGNYVAFNMGPEKVAFEEKIDGESYTISEVRFRKDSDVLPVDINVVGNTASLNLGGRKIIYGAFSKFRLIRGGIGVSAWDEKPGRAKATIRSLSVSSASGNVGREFSLKGGCDPVRDPVTWKSVYGDLIFENKGLTMSASKNTNGVMAVLNDTKNLPKYHIGAGFKLKAGSDINLLFRYKNEANYAYINIGGDSLQVRQVVNGKTQLIKSNPLIKPIIDHNYYVELYVSNNHVSALINNQNISGLVNPALSNGYFGLETWCRQNNNANIFLKWLDIES